MDVRRAVASDAAALHRLAAATFPLACPPHTTDEAKAAFIAANLTPARFDEYLADPARELFLADVDGVAAGYTMLIVGEPTDDDVRAAVTARPTAELSKFYVLPGHHGTGISAELMAATVGSAWDRGVESVWLGVNNENARANRFYEKNGFVNVGTKRFKLGERWEDDFVRTLEL